MAANSLTNILPKILARGLLALREKAVMPRLINRDFDNEAAQKGQTIDVPLPKTQTASDVTASPSFSSAQGNTPGLVQVSLNQWKHSDFYLTDKEMVEVDRNRHFVPMQSSEAIKALANSMDQHIHSKYTGIYGYVGTAGTTPFSTISTATDARKVLNQQLAPVGDRMGVLDPSADAQALQLAAFSDVEKSDDARPKIEGEIGRKLGFDWFMSQNVQTHTAGTAASIVVASATASGVSAIDLKTGSSASDGTLLVGDIFTIAGDSQTYVVTASINLSTTAQEVSFNPNLKLPASTEAVTLKATHIVNLGFHPNAWAFGNRPLMEQASDDGLGSMFVNATDPETGLSLRLEVSRQFKQITWDFDVLYGAQLIRPELAERIAG